MIPLSDFLLFCALFTVLYLCLGYGRRREAQPLPARRLHRIGPSRYGHYLRVGKAAYYQQLLDHDEVQSRVN